MISVTWTMSWPEKDKKKKEDEKKKKKKKGSIDSDINYSDFPGTENNSQYKDLHGDDGDGANAGGQTLREK
ncbi:hypothetical protein SRHO_G00233770 [Serrasalmus rhombeus]